MIGGKTWHKINAREENCQAKAQMAQDSPKSERAPPAHSNEFGSIKRTSSNQNRPIDMATSHGQSGADHDQNYAQ
jgi:hypothetical protein